MFSGWRHVTKLDPDKPISKADIAAVASSGTDAVIISGTQNVTEEKIAGIVSMLEDYDIPKIIEPSIPLSTAYDVDYVFVPSIMNTDDATWLVGKHKEWIQNYEIDWRRVVPEAYIVLNPDSAVGKLTGAKTDLSTKEIIAYATCADRYFNFPIVYIEYSGTYGDPTTVKSVRACLEHSTLFYGGGINSRDCAFEMGKYANVIVVGNILYESLEKFMETVVCVPLGHSDSPSVNRSKISKTEEK
jgi:phosphoglycerol geranylgeranyltransferase